MAELQIIGGPQSNFVWTTRIVCAEKGVPYQHVAVLPHTPEVDAIHPFGKIPVMRHGDVTLCESRAIISYIDRTFDGPSLLPRDPVAAAQVEQWASIVCTTIDPLWLRQYYAAYVLAVRGNGIVDRARIDETIPKMAPQFAVVDRAVAKTGYLVGDSFTLADAYLTPIAFYMNAVPESAALMAKTSHLKAYLERQMARQSVQQTKPQNLVHEMLRR
ncbi:MAG TPA: glutathione S-transferase family protein [Stellaceae bacterium]|jgi:glutathione S-transferase